MARKQVRLGPKRLGDGVLTLRRPRLRDAAAWSAARLANREWLERAFPAWGGDWAAEQSETAWVQRWWHLRRASARGLAKPLVVLLDGRLVGELGVDAVDPRSGGGEASVWMVRSHGSADVMGVASLLLLQHAFGDDPVLDRIVSPVATSSRKGRAPGLTAAGLRIEATLPRRVGDAGLVDHDIWTIANTAAARARVDSVLARIPAAEAPDEARGRLPAAALVRAAVRGVRGVVRARRHAATPTPPPALPGGITLIPASPSATATAGGAEWSIRRSGRSVGTLSVVPDLGTGCVEIEALAPDPADRPVLGDILPAVLAWVGDAYGDLHPAVRVPAPSDRGVGPDATPLSAAGLSLVAEFAGNPEGRRGWAGEQRWEPSR